MTTALLPAIHEAYPIAEAAIEELAEQYGDLTIAGLQDKGGYEQVHKARMVVKGYRVDIEKTRKELKAEVLERGRAIDSRAKELTALISPVEAHLEAEEKAYTEAHEAIKREAEEKRQAALVDKVNRLAAVGFQSTTYAVESWTDEQFETTLAEATKAHAAEQERLAAEREAEAKAEAERQRVAAEQAEAQRAEAKRLAEEREKLEAEQRKLAEEKARIAQEQRERDAAEKARQDERDRIEREKRDAELRAQAEAAEKARLEALRPDKEKLLAVAAQVEAILVPVFDDPASDAAAKEVASLLRTTTANIRKQAEALT